MNKILFNQLLFETKKNVHLLTDEEIMQLIDSLPMELKLQPIKKNPKKYKIASRIDSNLFRERQLPKMYIEGLKNDDPALIGSIAVAIADIKDAYEQEFNQEIDLSENIKKIIRSKDEVKLYRFLKFLEKKMDLIYCSIYMKLMGVTLNKTNQVYLETFIKLIKESNKFLQEELEYQKISYDAKIEQLNLNFIKESKQKNDLIFLHKKDFDEKKIENNKLKQELLNKVQEVTNLNGRNQSLTKEITLLKQEKKEIQNLLSEREKQLQLTKEQLTGMVNEFNEELKIQWENDNEELLELTSSLEAEKADLICEIKQYTNKIAELRAEELRLKNKVDTYHQTVNNFIENIDLKYLENHLTNYFISNNTSNSVGTLIMDNQEIYIKENYKAQEVEECEDINHFVDNLASNLQESGVLEAKSYDLSNYIIGMMASGLTPLICGYKARNIATAISSSYSGESPYIITLPSGFNNPNLLIQKVRETTAKCVLIEDVIGSMSERCLLPLLREFQYSDEGKVILLSCEEENVYQYMPTYLLGYVSIMIAEVENTIRSPRYIYSNAIESLREFENITGEVHAGKELRKIIEGTELQRNYHQQRSVLLKYFSNLADVNRAYKTLIRNEIKVLCSNLEFSEKVERNLTEKNFKLNFELIDSLREG